MPEKVLLSYLNQFEQEFLEQFIIYDSNINEKNIEDFKVAFIELLENLVFHESTNLPTVTIKLAQLHIQNEINYILLSNHLNELKNSTIKALNEKLIDGNLLNLLEKYEQTQIIIAQEYLYNYINKVTSSNHIRLASLNDMIQKNIITYYEEHLLWLNSLIRSIKNIDQETMPEINPNFCNFGKWLNSDDAKLIIKNNSKYKNLMKIHEQLHDIGMLIDKQLQKSQPNFHVLMNYLEKCELISLSIGTELALIDNTMIIKKASKDDLTGALNRNSLDHMFHNQYELSLATDSNFVLAMCDLDHFKFINDSYGHLAGDKLLKTFVKLAHEILRKSDVVIRYGGEEFLILLPNTNENLGLEKIEQLREAFQEYSFNYEGDQVKTTVSIGLIEIKPSSVLSQNNYQMNDYIKKADNLLYKAKQNGRNRICNH